jgi:hypothetical protein
MTTGIKYYRKPAGHFLNILLSPEACMAFFRAFLCITGIGKFLINNIAEGPNCRMHSTIRSITTGRGAGLAVHVLGTLAAALPLLLLCPCSAVVLRLLHLACSCCLAAALACLGLGAAAACSTAVAAAAVACCCCLLAALSISSSHGVIEGAR